MLSYALSIYGKRTAVLYRPVKDKKGKVHYRATEAHCGDSASVQAWVKIKEKEHGIRATNRI